RENMDNNGLTVVQSGNCQIVFKRAPIIGDSGETNLEEDLIKIRCYIRMFKLQKDHLKDIEE
ncbi:MAG: hypothetical protein EZS28_055759, partial [Streblomastix strix]